VPHWRNEERHLIDCSAVLWEIQTRSATSIEGEKIDGEELFQTTKDRRDIHVPSSIALRRDIHFVTPLKVFYTKLP
jgi:hypothetical protein